ncbi:MAG: hypothetical protein GXO70_07655 [Acidobacteria bacterium]|nr:hypothetical protein [Acidobacteriota bacterium]
MKILKGLVIVLAVVSVAFLIGCKSEAPAKKAPAAVEQATPAPAPAAAVEEGAQTEEVATPAGEETTETKAVEGTEQKAEEPKAEEPKAEEPKTDNPK